MATSKAHITTVRNTSGKTMFFAFIGERGATLTSGQDVDITGTLWDRWMNDTIQTKAIKYALENNLIEIVRTPGIIRYDSTTTIYRDVAVSNGSVIPTDPSYGSYSGTAPST